MGGAERALTIKEKKNISVGDLLSVSIGDNDKITKYEIIAPVGEYKSDKRACRPCIVNKSRKYESCGKRRNFGNIVKRIHAFDKRQNFHRSRFRNTRNVLCITIFPKPKTVTVGSFSEIGNGARVFVHRYYDSARTVVIYQE
ncbi:MAG: hypothetical protein L6V93_21990 [Clostridiales bacterium]|nr:MAG: hypothetical protein L6V93_21990 [Clostridiales bacterium]